ncbi:NUDIX domain-containing protein [Actinopolyspora erythraea]|uniref:NUDIX domain-containing protein n=1 Tax=Actinopolyspora erythraea TaxID=414996 RepID=A0A099D5P5_9ACTN|nr:NUDIX domain-containing protein [Actinopolyspora erythraea]ASU78919.1 NUDIX domain-containing protein [Actinopolyspora erythraea]KGI81261.1 hypothetical protein IL38_12280 [Actinopolyspora erythraea]
MSGRRYERVLVACLAVVPGPDGTVTFVRQRNGPFAGNWLLPGGGVEVGEQTRDAVVREVREETGCRMRDPLCFAVYDIIGSWPDGSPFQINMTCYLERGTHTLEAGFQGHNVDGLRQAVPAEMPLHSTDYRILSDAGVMAVPEQEIADRLHEDKLRMSTVVGRTVGSSR